MTAGSRGLAPVAAGELAEVRWVYSAEAADLMEDMSDAIRQYLRRTLES